MIPIVPQSRQAAQSHIRRIDQASPMQARHGRCNGPRMTGIDRFVDIFADAAEMVFWKCRPVTGAAQVSKPWHCGLRLERAKLLRP